MEIIKTQNLSFKYPNSDTYALKGISLTINKGEFVTICGKSGCGKSTLLRMMKPSLSPHGEKNGEVIFNGEDISILSQREQSERIGFVMQNPDNQIVTDKVWHELAFGLESLSYKNSEIRARVAEMASFFGIGNWFHKKTSDLSGGQKQLLNLASVMVMQPDLLVLDEPTSQLDPISAQEFLRILFKINQEIGTTIVLTEHRLEDLFPMSSRLIVMEKGEIIADGEIKEVGKNLHESKNDIKMVLPTPMRVHFAVENNEECPVSVCEGKRWLEKVIDDRELNPITDDKVEINGDIAIMLKDVHFRYDKDDRDILNGLSLEVFKGELYCILGGNGAGKTTALSLIMGVLKQYRGKIKTQGKTVMLPQDPQILFSQKAVLEELFEMEKDRGRVEEMISLCQIEELIYKHPYDLSGGEQQRVALAKVLLSNPEILLLDEPTKGFDSCFKEEFANILAELKERGITILMVSHDIEFCAEYADRCGMFFDGGIVSQGKSREFFSGKSFYTTSANRMARDYIPNAVCAEDIIKALGGKIEKREKRNIKPFKIEEKKEKEDKRGKVKGKIEKSTIMMLISMLFLIPLTILFGVFYLNDRKYYFISLLVILEILLPFAMGYERRKPPAREVVLISVLCAICIAGRGVFYMFPQIKPVLALVIISGACLGGKRGFLIGAVTAFVSNFLFGQGPWTPWQMFAFGTIGFISGAVLKDRALRKNRIVLAIFGGILTVIIYGGIMNPASVLLNTAYPTKELILSAYALGLPLDIIHGFSTIVFLWLIAPSMIEKIDRIRIKYGLIK